ncbi:MAG: YkgJ family cysteine cluster protein [Gammaproteobacteria bacterium]|nr:YkgJ family cysteine cluster protein [Gammaproteobacteria bacterium]
MSDDTEKFDLPFDSPVEPIRLEANDTLKFRCHKGVSCWNACCAQANVTLTPYDIIRLKQELGTSTTDVLAKHTVPFELDQGGMPGIKLRTTDSGACLFMTDEGCSVYENRPTACRYYPSGLLSMRAIDKNVDERSFLLIKEDHCKGHDEDQTQTVQEYREKQGVVDYDDYNREWYVIVLKKRSTGPAIGKPSEMSLQLFFMASYDMDRFRRFVTSDSFRKTYNLGDEFFKVVDNDDLALMQFGFKLMRQVLYGELSIPEVEGAWENRMEEREEILKMRKEMEVMEFDKRKEEELAAAVLGEPDKCSDN